MSELEFVAKHRFARITARKAGRIADLIRGRNVNEAIELLQFTPNRGASFYIKVVKSAVANASHDENVNVNRLFVCEARADIGPLLNNRMRFRPGPQGRAMPFAKRLSHLTIKVKERDDDSGGAVSEAAPAQQKAAQQMARKSGAKSAKKPADAPVVEPKTKGQKKPEGKKK